MLLALPFCPERNVAIAIFGSAWQKPKGDRCPNPQPQPCRHKLRIALCIGSCRGRFKSIWHIAEFNMNGCGITGVYQRIATQFAWLTAADSLSTLAAIGIQCCYCDTSNTYFRRGSCHGSIDFTNTIGIRIIIDDARNQLASRREVVGVGEGFELLDDETIGKNTYLSLPIDLDPYSHPEHSLQY